MLVRLPVVFLAISLHEFSHGYTAYKLGDPTAKLSGRLSINPLVHFDLLGAISFLVLGFGWAKPVPVNPMYFKNIKRGMSIVGLAGPLSNVLLSVFSAVTLGLLIKFGYGTDNGTISQYVYLTLVSLIELNIGFAIFNLIPIPPLDGSKVLNSFLPDRIYYRILQYERYAFPLLLLFMYFNILTPVLSFFTNALARSMLSLINFIIGV